MSKKWLVSGLVAVLLTAVGVAWLTAAPAPSIGAVAAAPAYVVINTPTSVLFTAHIPDQSVILNGVKAVRVDGGTGKQTSSIGIMHDDGKSGDVVAGDKVFSLQATLTRSLAGQEYYRIVASFKGLSQVVQSSNVIVSVDPFALPPDPGEAGTETLEGIDSDANGIRDDLQRHIALRFPASPETRRAAEQFLKSAQAYMIDADDPDKSVEHSRRFFMAWSCLKSIRGDANSIVLELEHRLKNSPERAAAFDRADDHLGGTVLPRTTADAANCE